MDPIGQALPRFEDEAILRGLATYTADLPGRDILTVAFARSWAAHATVERVDVGRARRLPGVTGAWAAAGEGFPLTPPTPPNVAPPGMDWPSLATDTVRYAGEPLAIVVAEDRYVAEDAVGEIYLDLDPLPVSLDPTEAAGPDAAPLFDAGSNVVLQGTFGDDIGGDLSASDVVLEGRFRHPRVAHMALEGRAFFATPTSDGLDVYCSHQAPHRLKMGLATALGLSPDRLRVRVPAVGGAFGGKSQTYPEYVAIAYLALQLGRPLRWIEDRTESFVSAAHGRAQNQTVRLAANRQGCIEALEVLIDGDIGAYPHTGAFIPPITALMMQGPYEIPRVSIRFRSVITNAVPTAPYRGAGRPEATIALEVMLDRLAAEIGISPEEVRARNFISSGSFPYATGTGETYDSGDYSAALDAAVDRFREVPVAAARANELKGDGIATFVERAGGHSGSTEFGSITVEADGRVVARSGSVTTGQGHRTSFAQIVASVFDIDPALVHVIQGDTGEVEEGVGTFASRSIQLGGSALLIAGREVLEAAREKAAELLEVEVADVEYSSGRFSVVGVPGQGTTIFELAASEELKASEVFGAGLTYPFGTYVADLVVDAETGATQLRSITAADDCGNIINPLLVEGQTVGSIAQGVGTILLEQINYDDQGQPLSASMMDYLAPTASEMPDVHAVTRVTPSPTNPLGAKGAGEAGSIGTPAAVANAILGILRKQGAPMDVVELPFTPESIWKALKDGTGQ